MNPTTCDECRAQMPTGSLLNKLRCADCRQVQFEQSFDLVLKVSLIAVGAALGWLFAQRSADAFQCSSIQNHSSRTQDQELVA